jgi:amino acid permease
MLNNQNSKVNLKTLTISQFEHFFENQQNCEKSENAHFFDQHLILNLRNLCFLFLFFKNFVLFQTDYFVLPASPFFCSICFLVLITVTFASLQKRKNKKKQKKKQNKTNYKIQHKTQTQTQTQTQQPTQHNYKHKHNNTTTNTNKRNNSNTNTNTPQQHNTHHTSLPG